MNNNNPKDKSYSVVSLVRRKEDEIYKKWGEDRFVSLLDPDVRNRFIQMKNKYNAVIKGTNYLSITTMAEGMLRAFDVCEQNVIDRGHEPLGDDIWEFKHDGQCFLLVKDKRSMPLAVDMAKKNNDRECVWYLEEFLKLIPSDAFDFINKIKQDIPGSEVMK
tara:strand:- start:1069 stop:1554 length:486 start_codon:yes stop_codon:yes gene_type:complete